MEKRKRIESEIRKTLAEFDRAVGLEPDPYFFTRLSAKIAGRQRARRAFANRLRPALLAILFVLNAGTAVWYWGELKAVNNSQARQELATILAGELKTQTQSFDILKIK